MEGEDFSGFVEVVEGFGGLFEGVEIGETVGEDRGFYDGYRRSGLLELGGKGEGCQAGGEGEGNEGGRDVEIVEGTGHGVLSADGGEAQLVLGSEGSEQGGEGESPAFRVLPEFGEIFLEGEADVGEASARRDGLADGFGDGVGSSEEGGFFREIGIEAPCHVGGVVGFAFQHWEFRDHGVGRGELVLAAEGPEDGVGTDGGIEHFAETFLGGDAQGAQVISDQWTVISGRDVGWGSHVDLSCLLDAVGVEESSAQVDDFLAAPVHDEAAGVGDVGDVDAFEVFLVGLGDEITDFRAVDADGHAFLGFGDGEFGAVEAVVFFRDGVEVDDEGGGDFADGDGDTAGSEVVADLDFAGEFRVAEQALDLAFGGGVALLDFGGVFEGGFGVLF